VDLLFFFKDAIDEDAIKAILHPLWDLQFKVGHQIRSADDLKKVNGIGDKIYAKIRPYFQ